VEQLITLLPEGVESVLDLGCGDMYLRRLLKEDVRYTPLDKDFRAEREVIICDLNTGKPRVGLHDVAWATGLFEFVDDVPRLARWLSGVAPIVIGSYRYANGWKYSDKRAEFLQIWEDAGYRLEATLKLPEDNEGYLWRKEAA